MTTRQMVTGIAATAILIIGASSAKADTITVTLGSASGGVFNYIISEDAAGRISDGGSVPTGPTTPFISNGTRKRDGGPVRRPRRTVVEGDRPQA